MMNKYLSDKLKEISFILIILVVFVHSSNLSISMDKDFTLIKKGFNSFIQYFISDGIARIAVPFFFAISGYLFFINIKKGLISEFLLKYRKSLSRLVLPYLLWSLYGILLYLALQSIPQFRSFFTQELIRDYSFSQILSTIFLHPIPYQLWFMRDLVVLVFISPIIYWSVKHLRHFIILFFLILWLLDFNYVVFSNRAILFFTIGAFFSVRGIYLQNFRLTNQYLLLTISWISLIFCKTYLSYLGSENNTLLAILHKTSILTGMLAFWFLYDRLFKNKDVSKTKIYKMFQFTFFLYAFHEPILTITKKTLYFILGTTELSSFLIYLLAPTLTIFISIIVGFYVKRILPGFYNLITGRR